MANTNTPAQSTYQQQNITFYRDTNIRKPDSSKDRWFKNVFLEAVMTPNNNEKTYYLRNRGGVVPVQIATQHNNTVRGSLIGDDAFYYVSSTAVMRYSKASGLTLVTYLPTDNGKPVGMSLFTVTREGGEDVDYTCMIIGDGDTLWVWRFDTATLTDAPALYPTPFLPFLETVDGYLLMIKAGTDEMYSSQNENLDEEYDFIAAELYHDNIRALSRYNNYVACLGQFSVELFFNAAVEDGSPFQRNDSTVVTVGCTSPHTVIQSERQMMWVGNSQEGELGVWVLEKFDVKEITSPLLRRVLSDPSLDPEAFSARVIRHKGHKFYMLSLGNASNKFQHMWLYDMQEKFWYEWTIAGGRGDLIQATGDLGDGTCYIINNRGVYHLTETSYVDDTNLPITFAWQTDPIDFGSMNRKVAHRLTVVGNKEPDQVYRVSWSDDDSQTWSPWKEVNMNLERPAIVNMGKFRRRVWRVETSQALPIRVEHFELYYNLMGN